MRKSFWAKITGLTDQEINQGEIEFPDKMIEEQEKIFDQLEKNILEKEEKPALPEEPWLEDEGELRVDVCQTDKEIIIQSTIAGIKKKDIEIAIEGDIVTIRGTRHREEVVDKPSYFHQECFWGKFSRSILLPCEVDSEQVKASLKNGVLTIILPKIKEKESGKKKSIKIKK